MKRMGQTKLPPSENMEVHLTEDETRTRDHVLEAIQSTPKTGIPGKVLFLGTGSAVPSKYRNVSSTLLQLSSTEYVMLDCGEGTLNQLMRLCPDCSGILRGIRAIVISHSHADHHLGLPLLLVEYAKQRGRESEETSDGKKRRRGEEVITIVGPARVKHFLDVFSTLCPEMEGTYRYVVVTTKRPPREVSFFNAPSLQQVAFRTTQPTVSDLTLTTTSTGVMKLSFSETPLEMSFFPVLPWCVAEDQMDHMDDACAVLIASRALRLLFTGDGRPALNVNEYFPAGIVVLESERDA